jgi:hypothetical protein
MGPPRSSVADVAGVRKGGSGRAADPAARDHQRVIQVRQVAGQWVVVELMETG